MAWTSPKTWAVGDVLTAADMNTYVRDNITALATGRQMLRTTPAAPTGTTDTTGKMMGLAAAITPTVTTRVLAIVTGTIRNNTAGDGAEARLRFGTGAAPANGAAPTGTICSIFELHDQVVAAAKGVPFTLVGDAQALTRGTAYWFDVDLAAITAGTAAIVSVYILLVEI